MPNTYEHSDEQAEQIGKAAYDYILTGEEDGLPFDFRGLAFYGVVRCLRENYDALQSSEMSAEQSARLRLIEHELEQIQDKSLQFYPFGHDENRTDLGDSRIVREMRGEMTSWGSQGHSGRHSRGAHGGEVIRPPISPKDP